MSKKSENATSNTTTQLHTGIGDNHVTNQITATSAVDLEKTIRAILKNITYREYETARKAISTLKTPSNLTAESDFILDTASIIIELIESGETSKNLEPIESLIESHSTPLALDLGRYAKCLFIMKRQDAETAQSFYETLETPGTLTAGFYLEHLATTDELRDKLIAEGSYGSESILSAITRGLIRNQDFSYSAEAATTLNTQSPSLNARFLVAVTKFNETLVAAPNHYWKTSAAQRKCILDLAEETSELIDLSFGKDKRIAELAQGILRYCLGESQILANSMWKNINNLEKHIPDTAKSMRNENEANPEYSDNIEGKIARASKDNGFREQLIRELENCTSLSPEDGVLMCMFADSTTIRRWTNSGGSIDASGIQKHFAMLELLCASYDNKPETNQEIRQQCIEFNNLYADEIKDINPQRLTPLSEKLVDIGLAEQAARLTKSHIIEEDLWPSELMLSHMRALHSSNQFKSLETILSRINENLRNSFCWILESLLLEHQGKISEAQRATKRALELSPESPQNNWHLVYLYIRYDLDKIELRDFLSSIPSQTIQNHNPISLKLLFAISDYYDPELAEKTILRWFLDDPEKTSETVTNFYLRRITENPKAATTPLYIGDEIPAYTFKKNGVKDYCFIANRDDSTHSRKIIKPDTPMFEVLEEGQDTTIGMSEITEIARIPPLLAAFQIASQIRQANNFGFDSFFSFEGETPEESIEQLLRTIKIIDAQTPKELPQDPKIPLFMKGYLLGNGDPVQNAFDHLCSAQSFKHSLPNFGIKDPDVIVIDTYSALLLSITGAVSSLAQKNTKCVITKETRELLERWATEIKQPSLKTIGVTEKGKIWSEDSHERMKRVGFTQKGINILLDICEEAHPELCDIPEEIASISDSIDQSILSSLILSVANDIPWFCIDPMFAHLFNQMNCKTIDASTFLLDLISSTDLSEKKTGIYLHISANLPRPIPLQEMIELSSSDDHFDHYFLSRLIRKYPNPFKNQEELTNFISVIATRALLKTIYRDHPIWKGSRTECATNESFIEHLIFSCFYAIISTEGGKSPEEKLASLLNHLFIRFKCVEKNLALIDFLATQFARGHFLSIDKIKTALDHQASFQ
ncbi:hypothetical protein Y017_13050 [Alcanivorax sp. 97CO-5]|uniref:PIN domain-containing protein n=1 Tax=unclassified Alcanivorax TaxID=2638842 RepID=UPI0003E7EE2D|nr:MULTISPECIES: hypothetical protein [unclassified Alcanivorax]EUC69893.1 hypothetical protein Y017_13050 [Alcanivorax sp. 97CO-5]PKG01673.1 hypothetical protein Y019_07920 [Alcanivorax sp. 97CO-6]